MHLFISNFKREFPVLAGVIFALWLCEAALRLFGARLSWDLRHIDEIPRIVSSARQAHHPSVLGLGNSLLRRGVDVEVLVGELSSESLQAQNIHLIYPDDTHIAEWLYLYRHLLHPANLTTDCLLITFAEEQLRDSPRLRLDLLGGKWSRWRGLPDAFRMDVRDFDSRMEYLCSTLSSAYANRERVSAQLLGMLIPHYKSSAQVMNNVRKTIANSEPARGTSSYRRLKRLLELTRQDGRHVVFVAMPLPALYPLDSFLKVILRQSGAHLIDLRQMEGLSENDFLDGYHLSPKGAALFSRELAGSLRPYIRRPSDSLEMRSRGKHGGTN